MKNCPLADNVLIPAVQSVIAVVGGRINQCLEFDQKSHIYFLILVTVQPPVIAKEQPGKL